MFSTAKNVLKLVLPNKWYLQLQSRHRSRKEARQNKHKSELRKKWERFYSLSVAFPRLYRKHCREPIDENKVVFIEPSNAKFSNNFQCIYNKLQKEYTFEIHVHLLRNHFVSNTEYKMRCREMLKDVATARYVLIDEACQSFAKIKIRKETQIAQVWHACGAFKRFGFGTADMIFGSDRKTLEKYPQYKCSFVAVSSPEIVSVYAKSMGIEENKILPIGVSRTDVFFDQNFISSARKKLELYMPSSKGKKVILFAPTFRGRVAHATTAVAFSVERFYHALSSDYVLLIKHHPNVKTIPEIPEHMRDFAVDCTTNVMTIEELLCVADICISDYSSLVFEYSLFERPMIFFNYDIDEYFDWRGFYYDYDELTPGPAFKTNHEMIDYIQHIDERFDRQRVIDFKNRFMMACDGQSTQRLVVQLFGSNLDQHQKSRSEDSNATLYFPENERPVAMPVHGNFKKAAQLSQPQIREKLLKKYPTLKEKKLIAYFITKRENVGYPAVNPYLDWYALFEDLDEQYAVICRGAKMEERGPKKFMSNRFVGNNGLLNDSELLAIADIVITDIRYDIVSYCVTRKPLYIYLPDCRWYCKDIEDYSRSVMPLLEGHFIYSDMDTLIRAIQGQSEEATATETELAVYLKLCKHYYN